MSEKQDFSSVIFEALGLPGLEIEKVKRDAQGEFLIYAKSADNEVNCHRCGRKTKPYGFGRELKIKHLPIRWRNDLYNNKTTTRHMSKLR